MKVKTLHSIKSRIAGFLMILAVAPAWVSCADEPQAGEGGKGTPVTILLDVSTRAGADRPGTDIDNNIGYLRVLIYNPSSGALMYSADGTPWNFGFDIPPATLPAEVSIVTGTYDFVFIVNETSDRTTGGLHARLAVKSNVANIDKLGDLLIDGEAFASDRDIPMTAILRDVAVKENNVIEYVDPVSGSTKTVNGTWSVPVERAAARLGMEITLTAEQYAAWASGGDPDIGIGNIPGGAYLLPGADNSALQPAPMVYARFGASETAGAAPGLIEGPDALTGDYTVTYERIILPELFFTPNDTQSKALRLTMSVDGEKTAVISAPGDEGLGYTLPRNTWLDLSVSVDQNRLSVESAVKPWSDAGLPGVHIPGQWSLTVDRDVITLPAGEGETVTGDAVVWTDYFKTANDQGWTIEIPDGSWFTPVSPEGDANVETRIEITAGSWTEAIARVGYFTLRAGNMRKRITVTQTPSPDKITSDGLPDYINTYVGAFWRSEQTGERLIRILRPGIEELDPTDIIDVMDGEWTASVIVGQEWIVLDTRMTSDPNVGWRPGANEAAVRNGRDPGFDEAHAVSGELRTVSGRIDAGNPEIYFRVGLTGAYTPSAGRPARYGIVLLTCKIDGGSPIQHRIWIRQGEGADYVMDNDDPIPGGTSRARASEWAPYNLAADGMDDTTPSVRLEPRGGIWADYPSQAGALFQYAAEAPNERLAYHPTLNPEEDVPGWREDVSVAWNAAIHETCPPGYRRPTSTSAHATSEAGHSLITDFSSANARSGNTAWGYYADGFFDRRRVGVQTSDFVGFKEHIPRTVAVGTARAAYVGMLFFNDISAPGDRNYKAKLFFPAGGTREHQTGLLYNAGTNGHYWSTQPSGTANAYALGIGENENPTPAGAQPRGRGYSIRCVAE